MKAKRMKNQRKIMQTYQMHYDFREAYQVLITSDCLRAMHAFAMPIQKFLLNTLQGKVLPYITQCTLAKVMEGYSGKGRDGRPAYLPPPMDVPLRYCKHKDDEGQERGVIPEAECLIDLLSGQVKGNQQPKNKNHFVLAAADWDEGIKDQKQREKLEAERRKRRRQGNQDVDVRDRARTIAGVPIIYVKRSVMVLEEPSAATDRAIRGVEKDKFKDGIGGAARGVKRGREDDDSDQDTNNDDGSKNRGVKRARGPNPMSVKKKQPKDQKQPAPPATAQENQDPSQQTAKRKRRGKRGKHNAEQGDMAKPTEGAIESEQT
ncbi:hypothetical protein LTR05_004989 [Lithohypha guttulata]|uniref:UTP23 sensor motif region domain-containing protein n=1 Tax=Lithohypha guttulata TaxID=1690604 RepID=A0AAN7SZU2_9EURO|nr:hypothetical protein LTR05_004989 [Lithohypha guttulata]